MTADQPVSDEEYEATRLKYYPNDPQQTMPERNHRHVYTVEEFIHHGNYRLLRIVEVYDLTPRTIAGIFISSAYCYTAEENSPQVARVLADLKLGRVNRSHGWSTFRVLPPLKEEL